MYHIRDNHVYVIFGYNITRSCGLTRLPSGAKGHVLHVVRSLNQPQFSLSDVYAHSAQLAQLHPHNAHIHPKIRQQLQVLRDLGLLEFLAPGSYRLR